jgi:hypothetical protein
MKEDKPRLQFCRLRPAEPRPPALFSKMRQKDLLLGCRQSYSRECRPLHVLVRVDRLASGPRDKRIYFWLRANLLPRMPVSTQFHLFVTIKGSFFAWIRAINQPLNIDRLPPLT